MYFEKKTKKLTCGSAAWNNGYVTAVSNRGMSLAETVQFSREVASLAPYGWKKDPCISTFQGQVTITGCPAARLEKQGNSD